MSNRVYPPSSPTPATGPRYWRASAPGQLATSGGADISVPGLADIAASQHDKPPKEMRSD